MKKLLIGLMVLFMIAGLAIPGQAAKEVKFGVVTQLSGGMALYGTNVWRGIQIGVEEVNAKGGITVAGEKYLLNPIVFDDEAKPDKALAGAKRISSLHKVPLIYTPASLSGFPLLGINEKEGFIVMCTSQSPPFTEKGNKLAIRHINSVSRTMKPWVQFSLKTFDNRNLKITNAGVMIVNTELGRFWANEFMKEWQAAGKTVVEKVSYSTEETDYYTQLTALLAKKPEMIVLTTVAEASARVIKQARQLGYKGIFLNSIAGDPRQLNSLVPADQLQGTFVEVGRWDYREEPAMGFIKKYQAKHPGEDPQFSAALAYEGVYLIAKALEIAGTTTDVYKIRAAFPKAYPMPNSIFGIRDLDEKGDVLMPVFLVEFKEGKIWPVKD
jgi:branched-chain amino acid transport system substrate-binding protein